ncbi:PQQ-dependent sugar dehydrogenase [Rhodococcus rhodnii]|uniref:Glucose dehydrogenase n=2 Tax=Rhodococcus rhodnii TaxID=38312 RepID=R7WQG5_9NOCA|nr:PQQ-dependent sugar dehydrogenase [Rhodococcus rhodnii]EOM76224.1 glucose dehydrogenase [Rhodococcus rhodnii LMG 5362]
MLPRIVAVSAAVLVAAGCARFDDSASSPFTPEPADAPIGEVQPESPPAPTTTPEQNTPPGPLGPCEDADPSVVATCLEPTGGLVVLHDGETALVAERTTGRILRVAQGSEPVETARVDVDSGGGLLDIALSPTYEEDRLIYAYVATASDHRVVRIAPGDVPKPVLTGIPRGGEANSGGLAFAGPGELMVATGDAGDPAAAADPSSLAGKVLRVRALTPGTSERPEIVTTGLAAPGGVCTEPGLATWVTDRGALEDRLMRIGSDGAVAGSVWTWPDRPGVAHCAAAGGVVAVSLEHGRALAALGVDGSGAVTTAPGLLAQNRYGALSGAAVSPTGEIWAGTVNKLAADPTPTDDRVVKIPPPSGGGGFD